MSWRCSSVREDLTESNRTLCSVEAEDRCVVGSKAKAEIPTTSTFEVFSVEEARIHGHLCGDGCVSLSREKRSPGALLKHKRRNIFRDVWIIWFTNTCEELLNQFKNDMKIAFNRKCTLVHNGTDLKVNSVKHIMVKLKIPGPFNCRTWFIPEEILNDGNKVKVAWLQAFFDDEATVSKSGDVKLDVVNKKGLLQVRKMLTELRILTTFNKFSKNVWRLRIRNKSLLRFHKLVGFVHPDKKQKLKNIIMERLNKRLPNI